MGSVSIAIVIPVYAGKKYLPELIARIGRVQNAWKVNDSPVELTEAVFVNDSSQDGSLDVLYAEQRLNPWVRIINLSRNFGQHQATIAGILHSSADWVVTLDEDLQHDPKFIETLLRAAVESELDIIYANPEQSVHENVFRDYASRLFKGFISLVTGNPHVRNFNSFRLIRGAIARSSASVCSHGTYFDIALNWFTDSIASIKLPLKDVRYVESGKSGYSVSKLFSHARRLIISSQSKVFRLAAALGFISVLVALVLGSKTLFEKIYSPESIPVQGWASLFLALMFFSGLLAVLQGIILEYISVMLLHIQGKPTFFVIDRKSDQFLRKYFKDKKENDHLSELPETW